MQEKYQNKQISGDESYYCTKCDHKHNPDTKVYDNHSEYAGEDESLQERFYPANKGVPATTIKGRSKKECDKKYKEFKDKHLNDD